MKSRILGLVVWMMVAIVLTSVGCSSKEEEAGEQPKASAAKEEQSKESVATVSSALPTGQWKAVEEKASGFPTVLTVHFKDYSSDEDKKALADAAVRGEIAATIDSFESHGGMQVGQQMTGEDGKAVVMGQFWAPAFVSAIQSGESWRITIASGSPFIDAEPNDVGLIVLTVPHEVEGGTARLYMATQVGWEKGQLVPKALESEAKVLKITSFVPFERLK